MFKLWFIITSSWVIEWRAIPLLIHFLIIYHLEFSVIWRDQVWCHRLLLLLNRCFLLCPHNTSRVVARLKLDNLHDLIRYISPLDFLARSITQLLFAAAQSWFFVGWRDFIGFETNNLRPLIIILKIHNTLRILFTILHNLTTILNLLTRYLSSCPHLLPHSTCTYFSRYSLPLKIPPAEIFILPRFTHRKLTELLLTSDHFPIIECNLGLVGIYLSEHRLVKRNGRNLVNFIKAIK